MKLQYRFEGRDPGRQVSLLILCVLSILSSVVSGASLSGSIGLYEPDDGMVRDLFVSRPEYSLKAGFASQPDFNWTLTAIHHVLESSANNLESEVTLVSIGFGFERRFLSSSDNTKYVVEPFFGAGVSIEMVTEILEDEITEEESQQSPSYTGGLYWETGILLPLGSSASSIEVSIRDHLIRKNILGSIHLGGQTVSVGYRWSF